MNGEKTKLYELTINESGIRFRHANPNPLSAKQKYNIGMAVVVGIVACIIIIRFFTLLR